MWGNRKGVLASLFFQDKAPLIVTLFFGALTWTVARTIDQLHAIPVLEYRLSMEEYGLQDAQQKEIRLRLRNVTYTRQFDCFKVIISPEKEQAFTFDDTTFRVELLSELAPNISDKDARPEQVSVKFGRFGPRADIRLVVNGNGKGPVRVTTRECQDVEEGSNERGSTPILLPHSLRTALVESELGILWSFILIWVLAILAMKPRPQPEHAKGYRRTAGWGREKGQ